MRVVAINGKGVLSEYAGDADQECDLGAVPVSCSTSLDSMCFVLNNELRCYRSGQLELVAPEVTFTNVAAPKNGMAVALYDRGTPRIEILFKPFHNEQCYQLARISNLRH